MSKKHWETYFNAIKKQDWEGARDSLDRLSNVEQDNPQVHLKIGDIYQRTGETLKAIASYHQSAWLLINQGFLQKALALYKIILRLDPNNAEAINKSKELMMELESARIKMAEIPTVMEEPVKMEEPAKIEEPVRMEDLIVRTSFREYREEPSEIPPKEEVVEDDLRGLMGRGEVRSFVNGEKVIEEGDSGDSIFIVKSGQARVLAHILGKEIELAILSEGDVFGEVAFLTGRPRTASVVAKGPLTVIEISRLLLEETIEKNPEILSRLEDFYEQHLQDTLRKVKPTDKK